MAVMIALLFPEDRNTEIKLIIPVFLAGFFCCAMMCHGELYRLRPPAESLTHFYLMISVGGALGGVFVGVLAPVLFRNYYELPAGLIATVLFVALVFQRGEPVLPGPSARAVQWGLFAALAGGLVYLTAYSVPKWESQFKLIERDFYGVLRVQDNPETDTTAWTRDLDHGTINHGAEFMDVARHRVPTTYYGRKTGLGIALSRPSLRPRRVGVIGLGAGTTAAYCRPGDTFRFYEINPMVPRIAQSEFFFLKECPATVSIVLGDARLSLEREGPQGYDVLAVDAFSGDSIPVHLLTVEAIQEYLRHLRPDGRLMIHVSNKYLDLPKVVSRAAKELHLAAVQISNEEDDQEDVSRSDWIALSRNPAAFEGPEWRVPERGALKDSNVRLWTDDYGSVLSILK
jgi:SAM-dependent methyltransferase